MKAINSMTPAMPVIHLHVPGSASTPGDPAPTSSDTQKLLTTTKMGPDLNLNEFCQQYDVSDEILMRLKDNSYKKTKTFKHITFSQLREMSFKHGEIASLQDAVEEWVTSSG